jgi:hypothetical protein
MTVQDENLPNSATAIAEAEDEAVSLFNQMAEGNSGKDLDSALEDKQLHQGENEPGDEDESDDSQQEQDADPWQSVPENLRSQFYQAQQANQKLQNDFQAVTGRLAPVQRELDTLRKQLAEREQQKEDGKKSGITADEITGMTDEELESEWPEVAHALKRKEQQLSSQFQKQLEPLHQSQQQLQAMQEKLNQYEEQLIESELEKLSMKHPDYVQVVNDGAFHHWLSRQSPDVQQLASSKRAAHNIQLLDAYKKSARKPAITGRNGSLKDDAEPPRKGGSRPAVDPNSIDAAALFTQLASRTQT